MKKTATGRGCGNIPSTGVCGENEADILSNKDIPYIGIFQGDRVDLSILDDDDMDIGHRGALEGIDKVLERAYPGDRSRFDVCLLKICTLLIKGMLVMMMIALFLLTAFELDVIILGLHLIASTFRLQ